MSVTQRFRRVSSSRDSQICPGSVNRSSDGVQMVGKSGVEEEVKNKIYFVKNKNARYLKKTHKFGIEVSKSVSKEYSLHENNVNTLWEDEISK